MAEISPTVAAELAEQVYAVQNERAVAGFLARKEFSKDKKITMKASVGCRILRATRDAFAVCAIGGGDRSNEIFLVFRGTTMANKKADVWTDARCGFELSTGGKPVHIGFNHAFTSMLPEIKAFLKEHSTVTGTVHCVGHSLGGAVATLAADWIARNKPNPVKLYTFGAPRVGGSFFASSCTNAIGEENMRRLFHSTDPVPMVPIFPFTHAPTRGSTYHLPSTLPLISGEAHKMEKYINSVNNKGWPALTGNGRNDYTIEAGIENWLKSKSPVDSSSATFWRWVDAALVYVLKKVGAFAVNAVQVGLMGFWTVADKIAYLLEKGITAAVSVSTWVYHLMRKLMQALGMKVVKDVNELTRALMRTVLVRILIRMKEQVQNAVRKI